jgi:hypothetical protein
MSMGVRMGPLGVVSGSHRIVESGGDLRAQSVEADALTGVDHRQLAGHGEDGALARGV